MPLLSVETDGESRIFPRAFGTPIWREKTVRQARLKLIAGGERDEFALTRRAVCGCEPRHPVDPAGATERGRVRAAIGRHRIEHLSHRNQTTRLRVDQPGVHPVSSRQKASSTSWRLTDSSAAVELLCGHVQTAKRVVLEPFERFSELVACLLHLAPIHGERPPRRFSAENRL
jgi:hypothetical protein